jgi:hypothetical protein
LNTTCGCAGGSAKKEEETRDQEMFHSMPNAGVKPNRPRTRLGRCGHEAVSA